MASRKSSDKQDGNNPENNGGPYDIGFGYSVNSSGSAKFDPKTNQYTRNQSVSVSDGETSTAFKYGGVVDFGKDTGGTFVAFELTDDFLSGSLQYDYQYNWETGQITEIYEAKASLGRSLNIDPISVLMGVDAKINYTDPKPRISDGDLIDESKISAALANGLSVKVFDLEVPIFSGDIIKIERKIESTSDILLPKSEIPESPDDIEEDQLGPAEEKVETKISSDLDKAPEQIGAAVEKAADHVAEKVVDSIVDRVTDAIEDAVDELIRDLTTGYDDLVLQEQSASPDSLHAFLQERAESGNPIQLASNSGNEALKNEYQAWLEDRQAAQPEADSSLPAFNAEIDRSPPKISGTDAASPPEDNTQAELERLAALEAFEAHLSSPETLQAIADFMRADFDDLDAATGIEGLTFADEDLVDPFAQYDEDSPDYLSQVVESRPLTQEEQQLTEDLKEANSALQSVLSLINRIEDGNDLEIGLQVVDTFADLDKYFNGDQAGQVLGQAGTGAAAILSAHSFVQAIEDGDGIAIAQAGLSLYSSASTAATALNISEAFPGVNAPALGVLNIGLSIANGDPIGALSSALMMSPNPILFGAGVVLSLFGGAFGGDPFIPYAPPQGSGRVVRDDNGDLRIESQGSEANFADLAVESLDNRMGGLMEYMTGSMASGADIVDAALNGALAQMQAQMGEGQAIIPERMPQVQFLGHYFKLSYVNEQGEQASELVAPMDVVERLMHHAVEGEAIVADWEADTIEAKMVAEQDGYWLTESQLANLADVENPDGFTVLALDLNGDGQLQFSDGKDTLFDHDNDGYREAVQWLGADDGLLVIDRALDGVINDGADLFNGALTGMNALAFMDADADGVLDASDPVFSALRIWQDLNQDGEAQDGEMFSLADFDIDALHYGNGFALVQDGDEQRGLGLSPLTLEGSDEGVRITRDEGGRLESYENSEDRYVAERVIGEEPNDNKAKAPQIREEVSASGVEVDSTATTQTEAQPRATQTIQRSDSARAATQAQTLRNETARTQQNVQRSDNHGQQNQQRAGLQEQDPQQSVRTVSDATRNFLNDNSAGLIAVAAGAISGQANAEAQSRQEQQARDAETPLVDEGDGNGGGNNAGPRTPRQVEIADISLATEDGQVQTVILPPVQLPQAPAADAVDAAAAAEQPAATIAAANTVPTAVADTPADADNSAILPPEAEQEPTAQEAAAEQAAEESNDSAEVLTEEVAPAEPMPQPQAEAARSLITEIEENNDVPIANDDAIDSTEDRLITLNPQTLLANDQDLVAAPLRVVSVGSAAHGEVSLTAGGQIRYLPDPHYHGEDSFSYTIEDAEGLSATAVVRLNIAPENDAPQHDGFTAVGEEELSQVFSQAQLLENAADVDGDTLSISAVNNPVGGSVTLLSDGSIRFTPDDNFNGAASFDYIVTDGELNTVATASIDVAAVNDAPTAGDTAYSGTEDQAQIISAADLLANAADIDGDNLTVSAVSNSIGGSAQLLADGSIRFTPEENFNGTARFDYTVSDGELTDVATASIDITAVNDAPQAGDTSHAVMEDRSQIILAADLLADVSDIDADAVSITAIDHVFGGTAQLLADGSVRFTPAENFNGTARFDYTVSDGELTDTATASIDVVAVNDAPLAENTSHNGREDQAQILSAADLLANAADVDGDALSITGIANVVGGTAQLLADGSIRFTPNENFNGEASFDYTVSDGELTDTATASIDIAALNDAPVTGNTSHNGTEDQVQILSAADLLANASDIDGDDLSITGIANVIGGTAQLLADGSIRFTPAENFNGEASFDYTVSDGELTDTATASIDIAAVNDAPVAGDTNHNGTEDQSQILSAADLLANASDIDGDALAITGISNVIGGTAQLLADGSIRFTPAENFNGEASFDYTVSDGELTDTATASIDIAAVNDAPVAGNTNHNGTEDQVQILSATDLLANATDIDGDNLSITGIANVVGGTAQLLADGSIRFTPDENFNGEASFDYIISDGELTDTATASIDIAAVNDAPVAGNTTHNGTEDQVQILTAADLLANASDIDGDNLSITGIANVVGGTAQLLADGSIRFTPAENFNGEASFDYTVSDGELTDTATASIDIAAVNDAPVAGNTTHNGTEDQVQILSAADLLANASDIDGDNLSITGISNVSGGTAQLLADGSIRFTPAENFNGEASFEYTVSDGELSDTATASIDIAAVNDAPVASNTSHNGTEDQVQILTAADLLANATDIDGDDLSITGIANVVGGTAELLADGSIRFTPAENFNGEASFEYTVSDGELSDTATASIDIAAVNDAPVAGDTSHNGTEDQAQILSAADLLANATDIDGDDLSITAISNVVGGRAELLADGSIRFTPDNDFNGAASFDYTVSDGDLNDIASASIDIAAVNDRPQLSNAGFAGTEDVVQVISAAELLAFASDVDGDALTVSAVENATGGNAILLADGSVRFEPEENFNGIAGFDFSVTDGELQQSARVRLSLSASNDAPVAGDLNLNGREDTVQVISADTLLAGASDADGDVLSVSAVDNVSGGSAVLLSDGSIRFTPAADFNGEASFDYTISDGFGGEVTVTSRIDVSAVNDAPVAANTSHSGTEDQVQILSAVDLLANATDIDGDVLSITGITNVVGGSAELLADGSIRFTPAENFNGEASFDYTVSDGELSDTATASIDIAAVNDAPVAGNTNHSGTEDQVQILTAADLLANAMDIDGDDLFITGITNVVGGTAQLLADGSIRFTPEENFNGEASFDYTVSDGELTDTATASIDIAAVNDAPATGNTNHSGTEDQVQILTAADLLANSTDVDGDALSITGIANVSGGTAELLADGSVRFTPAENFNGEASFDYIVSDGELTDTATASIDIAAVNDAPVAGDTAHNGTEDQVQILSAADLLANATDIDGDALSITGIANVVGGSAQLLADGSIRFTPDENFNGEASFDYTVSDGELTDTATASIDIAAVNDAPVAGDTAHNGTEDQVQILSAADLLANATDIDGDDLSIAGIANVSGGSAELLADGSIRFTPNENFNGEASFDYTVSDGELTDTATASIDIAAVNDAPVAGDTAHNGTEDQVQILSAADLLANATDIDGDDLSIAGIANVVGGTAELLADGSIRFTPDENFNGEASFDYTVSDGELTDIATASIDIAAVNDAPVAGDTAHNGTEDQVQILTAADLLANATDIDGDDLSITGISNVIGGTAELLADGSIRFTPDENFNGEASFDYTVSDGELSDTATASIDIAAVNDAPVAGDTAHNGTEDQVQILTAADLLANATDIDGDDLSITGIANVVGGSAELLADGSIRFTPNENFNGEARFDYTVSDGELSDTAMASIDIAAVNDAPRATQNLVFATNEDADLRLNPAQLAAGFADVDGDALDVTIVNRESNGTARIDEQGFVVFTPNADFNGQAAFYVTVDDGNGGRSINRVQVNVNAVNDAPVATQNLVFTTDEDDALRLNPAQLTAGFADVDGDNLNVTIVNRESNGTAHIDAQGFVVFTPNADFNGQAAFYVTVDDGNGGRAINRVQVNVNAVNDAPVAGNTSHSGTEDQVQILTAASLLANATDIDGNDLSITGIANVVGGSAQLLADGSVRFTPSANFNGTARFDYSVSDGQLSDTATAVLAIAELNDNPNAPNLAINALEDQVLDFSQATLVSQASDVDGDTVRFGSLGTVSGGSVQVLANGTVRFTPNTDFHGQAFFDYSVIDGRGGSDTARFFVNIAEVNDAPEAVDHQASGLEDRAQVFSAAGLLSGASDVDGDALSVASVSQSSGGVATLRGDGSVLFTPDANYHGPAGFQYRISDGRGGFDTAYQEIDLAPVNDAPTSAAPLFSSDEDTVLRFSQTSLLSGASDIDGDALTVTAVSGASNGSVVLGNDGFVTFTPNAHFHGRANFGIQIQDGNGGFVNTQVFIDYRSVNDVPVVSIPPVFSRVEDSVLTFTQNSLLAGIGDADGDALRVSSVSGAVNGSVVLRSDGAVVFTPDANFNGQARFNYQVQDGNGGAVNTQAVINYQAVNDAPVFHTQAAYQSNEDTIVRIAADDLLSRASDVDGDSLSIASVGNAAGGSVSIDAQGFVVFTPNANFNGRAAFDVTVSDGNGGSVTQRATLDYRAVNDAPVVADISFNSAQGAREDTNLHLTSSQLLAGASDVDGDALSVSRILSVTNGSVSRSGNDFIFSPQANYHGPAEIRYEISDGNGATATATARLSIAPVNDAPTDRGGSVNALEDTNSLIAASLLATDIDGDNLTVTAVGGASNGTVRVENGNVVYRGNDNFFGTDQFTYTLTDGTATITATAQVNVQGVNDAPVIEGVTVAPLIFGRPIGSFDSSVIEDIRGNPNLFKPIEEGLFNSFGIDHPDSSGQILASDPDGTSFRYEVIRAPIHGTASVDSTGRWTFESGNCDSFSGSVNFDIQVTDVFGASTAVTISTMHYPEHCGSGGGGSLPVLLDLDNDGLEFAQIDDDYPLQPLSNGELLAAWAAPDDGLLVYDYDGDRRIQYEDEVSFVGYKEGARTDLEGLAAFDDNEDGIFDRQDSSWAEFGVWQDRNTNGITDEGEFFGLDKIGIASINLQSDEKPYRDGGAVVFGTGEYERSDGSRADLGDVAFLYQETPDDVSDVPSPQEDNLANAYLQFITQIVTESKASAQSTPPEVSEREWATWQNQEDEHNTVGWG